MLFKDETLGFAMIKLLHLTTGCINTVMVKFIRNTGFLEVTTNLSEPLIFSKKELLGIVDLGSIGYYKVKQHMIWDPLKPYYEFKPL